MKADKIESGEKNDEEHDEDVADDDTEDPEDDDKALLDDKIDTEFGNFLKRMEKDGFKEEVSGMTEKNKMKLKELYKVSADLDFEARQNFFRKAAKALWMKIKGSKGDIVKGAKEGVAAGVVTAGLNAAAAGEETADVGEVCGGESGECSSDPL